MKIPGKMVLSTPGTLEMLGVPLGLRMRWGMRPGAVHLVFVSKYLFREENTK